MPSRRAATRIGGFCSGRTPKRKPWTSNVSYALDTFSPLSASCRKRTTSRTFLYGSSNGMPFHCADDHVRAAADADGEAPWGGIGQRGDATGPCTPGAGVGRHDGGTEPQPWLPGRGERQRGERVGTVGLRRPDVGVAQLDQLGELVAVGVQRAGQRHGHPGADRHRHQVSLLERAAHRRGRPSTFAQCSSGSPWPATCRPRRTCAPGRGRSLAPRREPGCRAAPTASAPGGRRGACCPGCCLRRAPRAPGPRPSARSRRGSPGSSRRRGASRSRSRSAPGPTSAPGRRRACRRARRTRGPWPGVAPSARAPCPPRPSGAGGRRTGRAAARRASAPTGPDVRSAGCPSAALTVRISRRPTWHTARAWVI